MFSKYLIQAVQILKKLVNKAKGHFEPFYVVIATSSAWISNLKILN